MIHFIGILIPLALLVVFLVWVSIEERTGKRLLASRRYVLDSKIDKATFIAEHVDWGAFAHDLTRTSFERALHDIAHGTLLGVRALERELTQLVRTLRTRRDTPLPAPHSERPPRLEQAKMYVARIVRRARKEPVARDSAE